MRFADYLTGVGRTVAYYPSLVPIAGSVTATVLLCQLAYWTDKEADPDGWIFKTQAELQAETGLTRYEQEGARKQLMRRGLIEERKKGIPAKLFYRLNRDAISDAWDAQPSDQGCDKTPSQDAENQHARMRKSRNQGRGFSASIKRNTRVQHQTTQEMTAGEGAASAAPPAPRPLVTDWKRAFGKPPKPLQLELLNRCYDQEVTAGMPGLTTACVVYAGERGKDAAYFKATFESCLTKRAMPGEAKPTSAPANIAAYRPPGPRDDRMARSAEYDGMTFEERCKLRDERNARVFAPREAAL